MEFNPYQSLVSLLSNILEAYTTAFFIVDHKKRTMEMVASQSLSKFLPERVVLPLEQSGILAQVQKAGQTIHMEKIQDSTSSLSTVIPFYREGESHIKGLFAAPVGDGAGVLYVDTKYSWGFNDKQLKWIKEISLVLQGLVDRHACMQQQRGYADIFEFWNRLDDMATRGHSLEEYCRFVVQECVGLLGMEYGFLAMKDADEDVYRVIAGTTNAPPNLFSQRHNIKTGLMGRLFRKRQNLLIPKMNPHTVEHHLFSAGENLPHTGTLWGLHAELSLGHDISMAFLSRKPVEIGTDHQAAVSHVLRFFQLLVEQYFFQEECTRLRACDLSTGLCNAVKFEKSLEKLITTSMRQSTPLTLALLQFEPWLVLSTKLPPAGLRRRQRDIAYAVHDALASGAVIGQLSENRFGIVFPGVALQDASRYLSEAVDAAQAVTDEKIGGVRLTPYVAMVGYPQDGSAPEELWTLAYQRLFAGFRSKSDVVS